MAQDSSNARRPDPYTNFKFRVRWDGRYVAGVDRCSALKRTTEVAGQRDRGDSTRAPKYDAITLERGITHAAAFDKWANKTLSLGPRREGVKDLRKNVIIEVYNEAGQLKIVYKVFKCWVSEYQAIPDLDANANAVAIQTLKLENEGWERDHDVPEPTEPSFTEPRP